MDIKGIIKSQYLAALEMLKRAIRKCPDALWSDQEQTNKFWHISYHVLFYTHLYLQDSEQDFVPWEKHREDHQYLGHIPQPPYRKPKIGEPYSKKEILAYLKICQKEVEGKVGSLNLEDPSGFSWLPFNKLELQFYNIRHIQHHAGQLIDRLRNNENMGTGWVVTKSTD
jgi:hypothetical protein